MDPVAIVRTAPACNKASYFFSRCTPFVLPFYSLYTPLYFLLHFYFSICSLFIFPFYSLYSVYCICTTFVQPLYTLCFHSSSIICLLSWRDYANGWFVVFYHRTQISQQNCLLRVCYKIVESLSLSRVISFTILQYYYYNFYHLNIPVGIKMLFKSDNYRGIISAYYYRYNSSLAC